MENILSLFLRTARAVRSRWNSTRSGFRPSPTQYPFLLENFRRILKEAGEHRPHYVWGMLCAADLARALKLKRISVLEFGVAGGKGLLSLEFSSKFCEQVFGVTIDVHGFDSGEGLPAPKDVRDLPHLWGRGYFGMDEQKLRSRLQKAQLHLGPLHETVGAFISENPSPVGFIAVDLDYYSSTLDALRLLQGGADLLLPRIHFYFDDIMGFSFGDCNGERLAISDFNAQSINRKISPLYGLKYIVEEFRSPWPEQFFMAHIFDHPLYSAHDQMLRYQELPID